MIHSRHISLWSTVGHISLWSTVVTYHYDPQSHITMIHSHISLWYSSHISLWYSSHISLWYSSTRWLSGLTRSRVHSLWLLVDHCVLRNWDRILVRAVKGLISRAGMVSICPLLWQRDVKLQQTTTTTHITMIHSSHISQWSSHISLWSTVTYHYDPQSHITMIHSSHISLWSTLVTYHYDPQSHITMIHCHISLWSTVTYHYDPQSHITMINSSHISL